MLDIPAVLDMDTVPATALDSTLPLMLVLAILLAMLFALPDAVLELTPEAQPAALGRSVTPAVAQSWSANLMVAAKGCIQRLFSPERPRESKKRRETRRDGNGMKRDNSTY